MLSIVAPFWQGSVWDQAVLCPSEGRRRNSAPSVSYEVHLIYMCTSALKGLYHQTEVHIRMLCQTFRSSDMSSSNRHSHSIKLENISTTSRVCTSVAEYFSMGMALTFIFNSTQNRTTLQPSEAATAATVYVWIHLICAFIFTSSQIFAMCIMYFSSFKTKSEILYKLLYSIYDSTYHIP